MKASRLFSFWLGSVFGQSFCHFVLQTSDIVFFSATYWSGVTLLSLWIWNCLSPEGGAE
jgi:hypothetical protein